MPRYIHPHFLVPWEWYIKPRYIHPHPHMVLIIRTLYFHSRKKLMRGWIYRNVIFLFPIIYGGCDYIVTLYFHLWQYLVRGWIYRDIIFSLLTIFGAGVIISWHYIFIADNIWSGGDYIVTQYSHPWQYLVSEWLSRDIIFSLLTIFREGWLYRVMIFSPQTKFGQGVIISWHYIFTPGNIWWGGDYIVTLYFHSW